MAPHPPFTAMPHDISLIATIATGFGLAMIFGLLAVRLRLPPLVGYLLAGVLVSPSTPGFVADVGRVAPGTPVRVLDPLQAVTGA